MQNSGDSKIYVAQYLTSQTTTNTETAIINRIFKSDAKLLNLNQLKLDMW